MAGALLEGSYMAIDKKTGMNAELVEGYQKIIASKWEQFTAAKAVRLQVVAGSKARISSSVPAPLLSGDSDELMPA
jgi:hypothetical protein